MAFFIRAALFASALTLCIAPAQAQAQREIPGQDTKYEPLTTSLEALLNDGYEITQMGLGSGVGFLLRKRSVWVLCSVRPPGGMSNAPTARSQCARLN